MAKHDMIKVFGFEVGSCKCKLRWKLLLCVSWWTIHFILLEFLSTLILNGYVYATIPPLYK